tara:strand:+ start:158 stop:571 length:414 start_codon:yes stop_codon:yes gene_type:complete
MNLINRRPSNDIFDIFSYFDYHFDNVVTNNYKYQKPNVLIDESDKAYFLSLDMPGIDKKDIHVTVDDGMINIKSDQRSSKDKFLYSEIGDYSYARSFYIPDNAQIDKIKAKSTNGVLEIEIPKLKQLKKEIKKISIS